MPTPKWFDRLVKQMTPGSKSSPSGGSVVVQDQPNPAYEEAPLEIRAPVPQKKSKAKAKVVQ